MSSSMLVIALVLVASASGAYLYFAATPAPQSVSPAPSLQVSQSGPAQSNPQLSQQALYSASHPGLARIAGILQQHPALKAAVVQAAINYHERVSK
ncbi:MAG TPA: hypothetical protein VGS04_07900 [Nitrososphaerales archaeon]|nr:hypothetical protein [Nitrososphaerales archaeon]